MAQCNGVTHHTGCLCHEQRWQGIVDRLEAENAALREIAERVAGYAWETIECGPDVDHAVPCPWCRRSIWHVSHAPDCLIVKARALLNKETPHAHP